jgi:hypothetical protein
MVVLSKPWFTSHDEKGPQFVGPTLVFSTCRADSDSDLKVAFRVLLLGAANGSGKLSLEIEAALPWQSDVEHEASGGYPADQPPETRKWTRTN